MSHGSHGLSLQKRGVKGVKEAWRKEMILWPDTDDDFDETLPVEESSPPCDMPLEDWKSLGCEISRESRPFKGLQAFPFTKS